MMKMPMLQPSSETEWKEYYQKRCKRLESKNQSLLVKCREAIDALKAGDVRAAYMALEMAVRQPILRGGDSNG